MKYSLAVLFCIFSQAFSLPQHPKGSGKLLNGNRHKLAKSPQDNSIPVSYLAGDDCDTCVVGLATVGMFRFDTKQMCFGQTTKFNVTEHAAATLNGKSYIISGFGSPLGEIVPLNYLKSVFVYDPTSNSYSNAPDLQTGRQQASAVAAGDGKIYIVGGYTKVSADCNTTEIFDGQSWTYGPETLTPRAGHVVVAAGSYVWVIGGLVDQPFAYLKSTEYLNLNSIDDGWQKGPNMNTARGFFGATVINNVIYACGGSNAGNNFDSCEYLALATDGGPPSASTFVASTATMMQKREDFTLIAYNNKAYAVAGYWPQLGLSYDATTIEEYDPVTDSWSAYFSQQPTGPAINNCIGCRATLLYVSESDLTC